ncbi:hypothetical protein M0812_12994 [Anaeramoeba flamelloides]|uniref:Uncharacterized protein n=1 Tax=Anaeramoeba flamelloides TaxID=1746091 RepID=A0AAV7ZJU9_9EUKA|nr:hypothetical protein M0812_12994 [Anaeramoeba flamelloides]
MNTRIFLDNDQLRTNNRLTHRNLARHREALMNQSKQGTGYQQRNYGNESAGQMFLQLLKVQESKRFLDSFVISIAISFLVFIFLFILNVLISNQVDHFFSGILQFKTVFLFGLFLLLYFLLLRIVRICLTPLLMKKPEAFFKKIYWHFAPTHKPILLVFLFFCVLCSRLFWKACSPNVWSENEIMVTTVENENVIHNLQWINVWYCVSISVLIWLYYLHKGSTFFLEFPSVEKPRFFRIKQCVRPILKRSIRELVIYLVIFFMGLVLFAVILPSSIFSLAILRSYIDEQMSVNLFDKVLMTYWIIFLINISVAVIKIIFTARWPPLTQTPGLLITSNNKPFFHFLKRENDPWARHVAFRTLHDLAYSDSENRKIIFEEDSGRTWTSIFQVCIEEISILLENILSEIGSTNSSNSYSFIDIKKNRNPNNYQNNFSSKYLQLNDESQYKNLHLRSSMTSKNKKNTNKKRQLQKILNEDDYNNNFDEIEQPLRFFYQIWKKLSSIQIRLIIRKLLPDWPILDSFRNWLIISQKKKNKEKLKDQKKRKYLQFMKNKNKFDQDDDDDNGNNEKNDDDNDDDDGDEDDNDVFYNWQIFIWAAETLSQFVSVSIEEDHLGLLQGNIVSIIEWLIESLIQTERYLNVDIDDPEKPLMIIDILRTTIYQIVTSMYDYLEQFEFIPSHTEKLESFINFEE